eukprot:SAG31_NODE_2386_length_5814_cov_3.981627_5_plen_78_part_00
MRGQTHAVNLRGDIISSRHRQRSRARLDLAAQLLHACMHMVGGAERCMRLISARAAAAPGAAALPVQAPGAAALCLT